MNLIIISTTRFEFWELPIHWESYTLETEVKTAKCVMFHMIIPTKFMVAPILLYPKQGYSRKHSIIE